MSEITKPVILDETGQLIAKRLLEIKNAMGGEGGLDTSDANAVASDILKDKTAYVNGEKITGTHECEPGLDTSDATAIENDVMKGKTFYANGEKKTGTHECPEGLDTSDATASASDITKNKTAYINGKKVTGTHECETTGLDTSDATGTADDVAEGVIVYGANGKIVGTVPTADSLGIASAHTSISYNDLSTPPFFTVRATKDGKEIINDGASIRLHVTGTKLGDATAEDVVEGKTFTSENGLKVTGTHKCPETTGIDTSDATATAEDMAEGTTAYVNGQKVTGSLPVWKNIYWNNSSLAWNDEKKQVVAKGSMDLKRILVKDAPVEFRQDGINFGDAEAADVAEGKTFTSSAGLKVIGTKKEASNGVTLPTLTNPGTADDLAEGVELIDADGNVITGTVPVNPTSFVSTVTSSVSFEKSSDNGNYISCKGKLSGNRLLRDGNVTVNVAGTKLGDATASDVAKGKTFTSASGLKITGTREDSSGGGSNVETFHITDADTVITPTVDGEVKVWGYGLKSSGSYSRTTYSFVGDGYYSGTSYGTPSKTSATFGIGTDGKVTGLPSGLTALDVLVTIGV